MAGNCVLVKKNDGPLAFVMTSGLARLSDMHRLSRQVRFVPILLQKSVEACGEP